MLVQFLGFDFNFVDFFQQFVGFYDLGYFYGIENFVDQVFLCDVFGFCFVGQAKVVVYDIEVYIMYIFWDDVVLVVEKSLCFGGQGQVDVCLG